mgnify:FL=1
MSPPLDAFSEVTAVQDLLSEKDLSPPFWCLRRRNEHTAAQCASWFCDAHARRSATSPCWECRQGAALRVRWAFDVEVSVDTVNACVDVCASRSPSARSYYLLKTSNAA